MKKAPLLAIAASLVAAACLPAHDAAQYQIPDNTNACSQVSLADGHIDGDAEFMALFDCLNSEGSLAQLKPMVDDLATTTDPTTGAPYLDDLIGITNGVLGDQDLARLVGVASTLVHENAVNDVLPVGSTIIDSGLAKDLLPVVQQSIDSGAAAQSLPAVSALFRYPQMPTLLSSVKIVVDDSIQHGWGQQSINDVGTLLATTDANGDPALRKALPPMNAFLSSGQAGNLIPVIDQLLDTGTVNYLLKTTRALSDQGVLAQMGPELRPLMIQDANGHSQMQGTLDILAASNGPLTCFGVDIIPNLAQNILSTMADRTPADIQNLVAILKATIGLGQIVCDISPIVSDNLDALDALAKSGALDGMLPMLKVFKAQNQIDVLTNLMVSLHDSGAMPALEPMLVAAIDAGLLDHANSTLPHLINADGTPTEALKVILIAVNNLVSPTTPGDLSTAPAAKLMPLVGAAGTTQTDAAADALFLLGKTMIDPNSGFSSILPAVSASLGADPQGEVLLEVADLIDAGTVAHALPMTSHIIASGNAEAMLPWGSQMIHDGTAAALLQMMSDAFDLMQTQTGS